MKVGCEVGWRVRKRRRRAATEAAMEEQPGAAAGSCTGGSCNVQRNLLVDPERHHRRRCKQRRELGSEESLCHMGGGGLTVSHPCMPMASLSHHSGLNSLAGLAVWRHKGRQRRELEAAKRLRCQQPRLCSLSQQRGLGWMRRWRQLEHRRSWFWDEMWTWKHITHF